ncbi:MAG TPA: polyprenyl synthetase family protein [Thermoanaerobaculia bacterium]|nr:polyprenyl synthetase family protein [Thermoanaerobaculia bacterium]
MSSGAATASGIVPRLLEEYRNLTLEVLLKQLPSRSPAYLYDLIPSYPQRPGKGLRSALCLATCKALGGRLDRALNSAAAIELFHNAFLVHDDVQDESESRRGGPTLHAEHGVAIAVNVGNAMNLLALGRLRTNRELLGPTLAWRILSESEEMMRHSLEGQALEISWIHDNVCDLTDDDYYRMCLKKTSWYTCIFPCRVGALIAREGRFDPARLDRFGWYLGAAFQIQDDLLNLVGDYGKYGKEISGDLWEGKRTLMVIHLLRSVGGEDRERVRTFLGKPRRERSAEEVLWLHGLMVEHGSLDFARQAARDLARAAVAQGEEALAGIPDSDDKSFLLESARYVIERDR